MSSIILKSREANEKFLSGKAVFRITSSRTIGDETIVEDKGIVSTYHDYEKLLNSHEYIPIINLSPLIYQLAYIFGCLNLERGKPRSEVFTFWYRELRTHEWKEWFVIQPYKD